MNQQKVCKSVAKTLVILCCIGLFLWNSFSSLEKYFAKSSTVTRSVNSNYDKLPFPSLSVCLKQPYNEKSIREKGINAAPWTYFTPVTIAKNESIDVKDWDSMVFQVNDVFDVNFDLPDAGNSFGPLIYLKDKDKVKIEHLDTFFDGRCFTVSTNETRPAHVALIIALKYPWPEYSSRNKFRVFIHAPEERINLVNQYWMARPPNVIEIEPTTLVDLVMFTQEHNELSHDSSGRTRCQGQGWGPYFNCYHRITKKLAPPSCELPTTREIFKNDSLDNCTTFGEIKAFQNDFIGAMYKVQDQCHGPCHYRSYKLQVKYYPCLVVNPRLIFPIFQARFMYINGSAYNQTLIWYMHGSQDIDVFTEIRLYDFSAIVAAVGGSLGLFLGFSCLDTILLFLNFIFTQGANS